MAVSADNIEADLIALFEEMDSGPMPLGTYAEKWAKLLAKHIKTAEIAADTFVVTVSGDATGTPNAAPVNVQ
jgi:hypothetical protein